MIIGEKENSGVTRIGIGTRLKTERESTVSSTLTPRTCELCGKTYVDGFSKRFCSNFCAHSYASRFSTKNASKRNKEKLGIKCKCEFCGENFDATVDLKKHLPICSKRQKYKRKNDRNWECKYCEKVFETRSILFEHIKDCSEKEKLPKDSKGRVIGSYDRKAASKKSLETRKKNGTLGHPCTDEQRAHIAEAMRKYRARLGILHKANVSEKACKYIDELNIQKGWELQHGFNGGEKQVGPYFLDGYDEKRNIAFEYFEKAHHKNHKKEERDAARARFIKKELNCKFFIYDELSDLLYEFLED